MTAQREVIAQSRIEVLNQRTAARRLRHHQCYRVEQDMELGPQCRSKLIPTLPVCRRSRRKTIQNAGLPNNRIGRFVTPSDGSQFTVQNTSEGEEVVALVLKRDAHRANPPYILGLALGIGRARRFAVPTGWPRDQVFGQLS